MPKPETLARWIPAVTGISLLLILLLVRKPWAVLAEVGTPDKPRDYLAVYGWWTALANAGLLLVLSATAHWWMMKSKPQPVWLRVPELPRWFLPIVAVAVLLGGFFSSMRLGQSLWDDEANSVRRVISGRFVEGKDAKLRFKVVPWEQTLWNYQRPTNHHMQSILSKLSLDAWRGITKPNGLPFSEAVMRLPSLIAGAGVIVTLAFLLWRLGYPRAGVFSAFLLAVHPWFIRYASELRGYIFSILFLLLALLFLLQALETGLWRWWAGFAMSWLSMLYAYPGTLFVFLLLSLLAPVGVWMRNNPADCWPQLARWLATSLIAGMVFLQLMVPCVPQVGEFMREVMLGQLTPRWHWNLLAHFLTGTPWNNSDSPSAGYPELKWAAEAARPYFGWLLLVVAALVAGGLIRLAVRRPVGWMVALVWVLPAVVLYATARIKGQYLYEWYLIFALPGVVALFGLGADFLAGALDRFSRAGGVALLVVSLVCVFSFTAPARNRLTTAPLQAMRESIGKVRLSPDPYSKGQDAILTAEVGVRLENYDPRIVPVLSVADLRALTAKADTEDKPLFVITGNPWAVAVQSPEIKELLQDEGHFELVAEFQGFDPTLTLSVRRYRPGTFVLPRKSGRLECSE